MTVAELRAMLDDYGDHVPVVIVMPNGTHREIDSVDSATGDSGEACAGIILGVLATSR